MDPNALELGKAPSFSIRQRELLEKGNDEFVEKCLAEYEAWKSARSELLTAGSTPTARFETATERSRSMLPHSVEVEVVELAKEKRSYGPRFGTLVHSILATVSLYAGEDEVAAMANLQGRILGAPDEEMRAAIISVKTALQRALRLMLKSAFESCRSL